MELIELLLQEKPKSSTADAMQLGEHLGEVTNIQQQRIICNRLK